MEGELTLVLVNFKSTLKTENKSDYAAVSHPFENIQKMKKENQD